MSTTSPKEEGTESHEIHPPSVEVQDTAATTHAAMKDLAVFIVHEKKKGSADADADDSQDDPKVPELMAKIRFHVDGVKGNANDPAKKARSIAFFRQIITQLKAPVTMIDRIGLRTRDFVGALGSVFIDPYGPNRETVCCQVEACAVLAAVAREQKCATEVVECGGVRALAALCDGAVHDKAVLALSAIARSSASNREAVHGEIDTKSVFVRLLRDPRPNLSFLLASLCRGDQFLEIEDLTPVLDAMVHLLSDQDHVVVEEAREWISHFLAKRSRERFDAVTRQGVQSSLAKPLLHSNPDVNSAALRALGQIAFQGVGKDANAIMAAEGVPPALKRLLLGSDTDNQRNICRILACSITGRPKHIDTLIDLDFFPRLIELHIKREVTKVMDLALFHGEEHQADYLVEKGCITALYDLLVDLGSDESETALHALRCLDLILGFGAREARDVGEVNRYAEMMIDAEGNAMLQNVYNESSNRWVRDEAQAILDAHFGAQQGCAANAAQKGDAQPGNAGLPPVYGRVDEERVLEILRQGEAYLGPCVFENLF